MNEIFNIVEKVEEPKFYDCLNCAAQWVTAICTLFTMIITLAAFYYACKEYCLHKKQVKNDLLSRLNNYYATDENIEKVVKELDNPYNFKTATYILENRQDILWAREIFLRFFEELELYIEKEQLDPDIVCYCFAYYAIVASNKGSEFVSDYNSRMRARVEM